MKADQIRINQLLEIEYEYEENKEYLSSRLEEIDNDYWYISMPLRKGSYVFMRVGQRIRIMLKYKNSIFGTWVLIVGRQRGHVPLLVVSKPQELVGINQKRTFVRLTVSLPVAFRPLVEESAESEQSEIFSGITGDISAGGILLLTEADLQQGQQLEIEIKLTKDTSIYCKAHVIRALGRAKKMTDPLRYAIEFIDITESQRDQIFKFIFDKQREWIRKGVRE